MGASAEGWAKVRSRACHFAALKEAGRSADLPFHRRCKWGQLKSPLIPSCEPTSKFSRQAHHFETSTGLLRKTFCLGTSARCCDPAVLCLLLLFLRFSLHDTQSCSFSSLLCHELCDLSTPGINLESCEFPPPTHHLPSLNRITSPFACKSRQAARHPLLLSRF